MRKVCEAEIIGSRPVQHHQHKVFGGFDYRHAWQRTRIGTVMKPPGENTGEREREHHVHRECSHACSERSPSTRSANSGPANRRLSAAPGPFWTGSTAVR